MEMLHSIIVNQMFKVEATSILFPGQRGKHETNQNVNKKTGTFKTCQYKHVSNLAMATPDKQNSLHVKLIRF